MVVSLGREASGSMSVRSARRLEGSEMDVKFGTAMCRVGEMDAMRFRARRRVRRRGERGSWLSVVRALSVRSMESWSYRSQDIHINLHVRLTLSQWMMDENLRVRLRDSQ
jgi:hypothetical protein